MNLTDILTKSEIDQINRVRSAESLYEGSMHSHYINAAPADDVVVEQYDEYLERIKNGEKIIGYQWNDRQQEKIPDMSFLDKFVPTSEYVELCDVIYGNMCEAVDEISSGIPMYDIVKSHYVNNILLGKPGTGKTSIAYALGAALQMHLEDKGCDDIAMSLTMRHCFAALKAIKRGLPLKQAVKKTIVNAIGIKDLELARDVYETVIEPMVLNA